MSDPRETIESRLRQGANERLAYRLTTTPWGSQPASVRVRLLEITSGDLLDVSDARLEGSPQVTGDQITTPTVHSLAPGAVYRLEIEFSANDGNTYAAYTILLGER